MTPPTIENRTTGMRTPGAGDAAAWERVRLAILQRWPHLDSTELQVCHNETNALIDFVNQRVSAGRDEVESVVYEFAPAEGSIGGTVSRGAHRARHRLRESALRGGEVVADHPAETALTTFVAGLLIGAAITAVWMRSEPKSTVWSTAERLRRRLDRR